jgi:hypothetical protein
LAHRRGEPRLFALIWTMFLLATAMGSLASVGVIATVESYRPAARILLVVVAVGIVVLWPMVRLCQALPMRGHVRQWVGEDLVVMLVPVQAVIWPQWWLAGWPIEVVAAVALFLAAWTLLIGAVLGVAYVTLERGDGAGLRTGWMVCLVVVVLAGPVIGLALREPSAWFWMSSPLTGVRELTHPRLWTGQSVAIGWRHWTAIGATGVAAIGLWLALGRAVVRTAKAT